MKILPSAYQEVEYIESSWTQYIDTWKTVSWDVKIDYIYMPKEYVTAQQWAWYLVFMDDWRKNNAFGSGNSYLYYWNNNSTWEWVSVRVLSQDTLTHDIVSKTWSSRDWGTVWMPSSSYPSPTWNLKLFVWVRSNVISNYYSTRMYSFKRYDSWVLTQDLVPCYRKSDNEIWLYDLVSDTFYTNAWTGTFSKWADVNRGYKIQRIYLGTNQVRPNIHYYNVDLTQLTLVNPSYWWWNAIVEDWEIYASGDWGIAYMDFSDFPLSSAKEIKITYDCYCKGKAWASPTAVRIGNTIPNNQGSKWSNYFMVGCATQTSSGYNNINVLIIGGTAYYTARTWVDVPLNTWSNVSWEVDLVNKTIKYTVNNVDKFSWSITDASVNNFTTDVINVTPRYLCMFLENWNRMKNIVINIE